MIRNYINRIRTKHFEVPFRKLTLDDKSWVTSICAADTGISEHINFVNMFLTQEMYPNDSFRRDSNCIIKKPYVDNGKLYCQYPIGLPANRTKVVKRIVDIYSPFYEEIVFFAASDENLEELKSLYGAKIICIEASRDNQDYILDIAEQVYMEGPEFHNRRKKISRFNKHYNWTYEPITPANMEECLAVNDNWYKGREQNSEAVGEQKAHKDHRKNQKTVFFHTELLFIKRVN